MLARAPDVMISIISLLDSIATHSLINSSGKIVFLLEEIECHCPFSSCSILLVVPGLAELPVYTNRMDPSFLSSKLPGCTWNGIDGGNSVASDIYTSSISLSTLRLK